MNYGRGPCTPSESGGSKYWELPKEASMGGDPENLGEMGGRNRQSRHQSPVNRENPLQKREGEANLGQTIDAIGKRKNFGEEKMERHRIEPRKASVLPPNCV